jgi:hypothetical protein
VYTPGKLTYLYKTHIKKQAKKKKITTLVTIITLRDLLGILQPFYTKEKIYKTLEKMVFFTYNALL